MQACGPVVRPHEILQTLIISIPQPSAAVKSFFELSRNFGAPEAMSALLLYRQQTADLPPIQRLAAGGEIYARSERGQWLPSAAGGVGAHRQGQKGTGHHMVSCPLLTPLPSFALTHRRCAAKRGLQGLGSVRRFAFRALLCPEFTLRYPPRITVRGHPVQGVRLVLRTAPLPSMVCPWSTERPCGPLAFRRATEGSRVQRKMRGSQEGDALI